MLATRCNAAGASATALLRGITAGVQERFEYGHALPAIRGYQRRHIGATVVRCREHVVERGQSVPALARR